MSFKAEFWKLQAETNMFEPTLQFQIQVSNDTPQSRFQIICYQARVECRPNDRHLFNFGRSAVSLGNNSVSPGNPSILSSSMQISLHTLEIIEEHRGKNELKIQIKLDFTYLNISTNNIENVTLDVYQRGSKPILIPRSNWRDLLDQLGYQETFVFEIPVPVIKDIPQLTKALDFLRQSKLKYIEGEDMGAVVTNCRQAIEETIGAIAEGGIIDLKELFDEESIDKRYPDLEKFKHWSSKIRKEIKTSKDFCGAGPHIEVPVTRSEARYALIHTANVLSYLTQILRTRGKSQ